MAFFMDQIRTMLPVLGLDFLREQRKPKATTGQPVAEPETSPVFSMEIAKHGIRAHAQEEDGEFYVLAGSRARDQWTSRDRTTTRLNSSHVAISYAILCFQKRT